LSCVRSMMIFIGLGWRGLGGCFKTSRVAEAGGWGVLPAPRTRRAYAVAWRLLVRPCSCCCDQHPCWIEAAGRTPHPPASAEGAVMWRGRRAKSEERERRYIWH
jgi:hypothetical protein